MKGSVREDLQESRNPGGLIRVLPLLVLLLASGGCQLIGRGSPGPEAPRASEVSVPMPSGLFQGFMEMEGGRVEGSLTLTPRSGRELEGVFESPPSLVATGRGTVRGSDLSLELAYGGECPGRLRLRGSWEAVSGTISGRATARDCTGEAEGTFLFRRF